MSFMKNENVVIQEFSDSIANEIAKDIRRFVGEMCDAYDLDFQNDSMNISIDVYERLIAKLQQFDDH